MRQRRGGLRSLLERERRRRNGAAAAPEVLRGPRLPHGAAQQGAGGTAMLQLKRAYEPASKSDGERILVERLWPRGVSREKAALDSWMRDVSPSAELRKWYSHQVARWPEFRRRYTDELAGPEQQRLVEE